MFGVVGMLIAMPVLAGLKVYLRYKFNLDDDDDKIERKIDKKRSSNNIKKKRKVESQNN